MASYNKVCTDKKRKAGICIRCKNPAFPGHVRCEKCLSSHGQKSRDYRTNWRNLGVCTQCGQPTLKNRKQCLKHFLSGIVSGRKSRRGATYTVQDLKDLLVKQNYKCGLTGDLVDFDSRIELDHIIPSSRGGSEELSNLRWVGEKVNQVKYNYLDSELKELCHKILKTI